MLNAAMTNILIPRGILRHPFLFFDIPTPHEPPTKPRKGG